MASSSGASNVGPHRFRVKSIRPIIANSSGVHFASTTMTRDVMQMIGTGNDQQNAVFHSELEISDSNAKLGTLSNPLPTETNSNIKADIEALISVVRIRRKQPRNYND